MLIVLSAIMILTVTLVEFNQKGQVSFELAQSFRDRTQAQFLAESGLNISKMILKIYIIYEKAAKQSGFTLAQFTGGVPFYKQPLGTDKLRVAMSAKNEGSQENSGNEDAEMMKNFLNAIDKDKLEKFLDFEGDFILNISEEQTKININQFYGLTSASKKWDQRKKLLYSLFKYPAFKDLFADSNKDPETLTHAIADWVDANGMVDEFGGLQRGDENSQYDGKYKVKNGKFLTLSELRLIKGMNDPLYEAVSPWLSVYGSEKVNVCFASPDLIKVLIYHFTHNAGCTTPIEYEDTLMDQLSLTGLASCPDESAVANAMNEALGLSDTIEVPVENSSSGSVKSVTKLSTCEFQFKDMITSDNNVFKVESVGSVGETAVTITAVFSTENSDPTKWSYQYYKVE